MFLLTLRRIRRSNKAHTYPRYTTPTDRNPSPLLLSERQSFKRRPILPETVKQQENDVGGSNGHNDCDFVSQAAFAFAPVIVPVRGIGYWAKLGVPREGRDYT